MKNCARQERPGARPRRTAAGSNPAGPGAYTRRGTQRKKGSGMRMARTSCDRPPAWRGAWLLLVGLLLAACRSAEQPSQPARVEPMASSAPASTAFVNVAPAAPAAPATRTYSKPDDAELRKRLTP